MTNKRRPEKKMIIFKPSFRDIFVCQKNELKPFMEIFIQEPENVAQQNLGTLVGIFEITDHSEDSSYIVNYLISVIKKEFFSRTNRGSVESFEAALHKANLALSKLASHENVSWIGNLNAICAVIEKNNLHVAQSGNATALLMRKKILTELTEGMDELSDNNPLKTFQDVLSGRMEDEDKLILTTDSIFDIFSQEEIKRSALKFSSADFIQFLNTALVNELDQAAVLVIDIGEEERELAIESPARQAPKINAFSEKAFQREIPAQEKDKAEQNSSAAIHQEERREIMEELEAAKGDFVDKRTGHIYIKENNNLQKETDPKPDAPPIFTEIADKSINTLKNFGSSIGSTSVSVAGKLKRSIGQGIGSISSSLEKRRRKDDYPEAEIHLISEHPENVGHAAENKDKISLNEIIGAKLAFLQKIDFSGFFANVKRGLSEKIQALPGFYKDMKNLTSAVLGRGYGSVRKLSAWSKTKWLEMKNELSSGKKYRTAENTKRIEVKADISSFAPANRHIAEKEIAARPEIDIAISKKILPDFSKLGEILKNLNYQQRVYLALFIVLIFIVPYWIAKWSNNDAKEIAAPIIEEPIREILPLEQDKNLARIANVSEAHPLANPKKILNLKNKIFAVTDEKIIDIDAKKEYAIPADFKNPDQAAAMDDLNLIFFIKNKSIASFSPASQKFQTSSIVFPPNMDLRGTGSYLTYLYVLDAKNNQIYRYPRSDANGGFGEKTNWMKSSENFADMKDMAINDNIFLADGKQIFKFFKNKKQDFAIENSATPIIPDKIFTAEGLTDLYILDIANSRMVKTDNDGKIIRQYHNPELKNALGFAIAINEEASKAYFYTENSVKYFPLP